MTNDNLSNDKIENSFVLNLTLLYFILYIKLLKQKKNITYIFNHFNLPEDLLFSLFFIREKIKKKSIRSAPI